MRAFRRRKVREPAADLSKAREATGKSARQAEADLEHQRERLAYEKHTIQPKLRELREKNHVAEAIIEIIKGPGSDT